MVLTVPVLAIILTDPTPFLLASVTRPVSWPVDGMSEIRSFAANEDEVSTMLRVITLNEPPPIVSVYTPGAGSD